MKRLVWVGLIAAATATAPQAQHAPADGVIWAASWEEAVEEATARNVPIHVTLHKDN